MYTYIYICVYQIWKRTYILFMHTHELNKNILQMRIRLVDIAAMTPSRSSILETNLVGGFNPSEKYESIGMIIPNIWENKIHVPNHQPVIRIRIRIRIIPGNGEITHSGSAGSAVKHGETVEATHLKHIFRGPMSSKVLDELRTGQWSGTILGPNPQMLATSVVVWLISSFHQIYVLWWWHHLMSVPVS